MSIIVGIPNIIRMYECNNVYGWLMLADMAVTLVSPAHRLFKEKITGFISNYAGLNKSV